MLFPTFLFAVFFPIVLIISWLLMPRQQLWKPFIIVASYIFYAAANWRFCLLHCRASNALPDVPVRGLLPDRADHLVAVDAASAALEAVHHRRELHLLRGRELALLPASLPRLKCSSRRSCSRSSSRSC